jgi:NAD(P)H-hydrate epimerase
VLAEIKRFGALVLGPGLGADAGTVAAIAQLVAEAPVPLVLDADGLNAVAGDLAPLRLRAEQLGVPTVLTPHDGEFARLVGHLPHADRVASASALAAETRAVVLLKGSTTTVAAPDGRVFVVTAGGPELASAGTGDALAGVLGAFLARGVPAFEAAAAAAYVHGAAGSSVGRGLVASDLLAASPRTLDALTETGV